MCDGVVRGVKGPWSGMTVDSTRCTNVHAELSPLGTSGTLKGKHQNLSQEEKHGVLCKQVGAMAWADWLMLAGRQDGTMLHAWGCHHPPATLIIPNLSMTAAGPCGGGGGSEAGGFAGPEQGGALGRKGTRVGWLIDCVHG